nr:GGDEF domain-containing protein [Dyella sp. ASV24]
MFLSKDTSINRQFALFLAAIYVVLLPFAAWMLLHQWTTYTESKDSLRDFDRFYVALIAMERLSVERLATAQMLGTGTARGVLEQTELRDARHAVDDQLQTLTHAFDSAACNHCGELATSLGTLTANLHSTRDQADTLLAASQPPNASDTADVIDRLVNCGSRLSSLAAASVSTSVQHEPDAVRYVYVASFAALLRDHAGQLGAQVTQVLTSDHPMSTETYRRIEQSIGKIKLLHWLSATIVAQREELPNRLIARIDAGYLDAGLAYAQATADTASTGAKAVPVAEFDRRYIASLAPITDLRDEALRLVSFTLRQDEQKQRLRLSLSVGAFALLTAFLVFISRQFHRKIVKPFVDARRFVLDVTTNKGRITTTPQGYRGEIRDLFSALSALKESNDRRFELEKERERLIQELRLMAETDFLTGLLNRRSFERRAIDMLSDRRNNDGWISLTAFDVDYFKRINDTYGHEAGDMALRKLSELAREAWRVDDIVGRTGGEEFAVMARVKVPEDSTVAARRLMDRLRREIITTVDGRSFSLTISCGVTYARSADIPSLEALMRQADNLLYEAKVSGRDRIELSPFDPRRGET